MLSLPLAALMAVSPVNAIKLQTQMQTVQQQTPMSKVVQLLQEMQARIMSDGKKEQQSYDKYACWCEDTLARKASDISKGKALSEELQSTIIKLKGEVAAHGAEIKQLEKDIQQNLDSQGEAKSVRDGEFEDYTGEKTESEQCIGALEAAVKALAGAGTGKFLETSMKQAELLSVVAGVRRALSHSRGARSLSSQDSELLRRFVEKPADFAPSSSGLSAAQVSVRGGQNPFGDYAPQSTQIQGILKGMYDTFASDLEKANAKEADSQKAFEALMGTKLKELAALQESHQTQTTFEAEKSETLSESKELLDATKAQLDADEKFFEETKGACQVKSKEWSERSRLRTEELTGVGKAIEILSSEKAKKTFTSATTSFLQLGSVSATSLSAAQRRQGACQSLSKLSAKYHSLSIAKLAVSLKEGGPFDKVMASIDSMIQILRAEEQADIQHRDRCQNAEGKNTNDMEDLNTDIQKEEQSIEHLELEIERLNGELEALSESIGVTREEMAELLKMRNDAVADFKQAVKDDTDSVALLQEALAALTTFFEKNKVDLSLRQEPSYTVDIDKAPETTWEGGNYGGKKDETRGIVAIMQMLIEDLEKEIKTAKSDDNEAQKLYEEQKGSMQESLDAQLATELAASKELAEVRSQKEASESRKAAHSADLSAEEALKSSLYSDCSWVKTHFDSRAAKRKSEMAGLVDAKGYLAGVVSGQDV